MSSLVKLRGLITRETLRFLKVPYQTIGNSIVMTSLYFLIFGVSIGRSLQIEGNIPYLAFLVPGMVALSVIRNAFENATSTIVASKYVNELQDLRVTPISIYEIALSISIASLIRGAIVGVSAYLVGVVFYAVLYGSFLTIAHPFLLLYFVIAGGIGFGSLGLAIGMYASSFEKINSFSTFILVPLIYLGGVFFSLDNLSPFWDIASQLNPLFYLINGMRYAFIDTTDVSIPFSVLLLFLFSGGTFLAALGALKNGARYQRF